MKSAGILISFLGGASILVAAEPEKEHSREGVQPTADRALATRSNTDFHPATHGFAFRNSFSGSPLPAVLRESKGGWEKSLKGVIEKNFELPKQFGLCGGMCMAAADFFYAGLATPNADKPPQAGSPLYEYLYQRQVESWGTGSVYALKFVQWMRLADGGTDSPSERSVPEIKTITAKVKSGELVPIGLVLVRGGDDAARNAGKPWDNHQVLCWKVESSAAGLDLHVYDPNYPKDEGVVIRVSNITSDGSKVDAAKPVTLSRLTSKGKATAVRGVFAMPYERRDVPESVKADIGGPK